MRGQVSRRQTSPLRSPIAGCHVGTLRGGAEEDAAHPSLRSPGRGGSPRARAGAPEKERHMPAAQAGLFMQPRSNPLEAHGFEASNPVAFTASPACSIPISGASTFSRPPSAVPPALSRPRQPLVRLLLTNLPVLEALHKRGPGAEGPRDGRGCITSPTSGKQGGQALSPAALTRQ